MKRFGRLVLELLRELSDESGYARFLAREGRAPSREAWIEVSDLRLRAKYMRAKCC
jgi:hypothetical protein